MTMTLAQLNQTLNNALEDNKSTILAAEYPDDELNGIIDFCIPDYYFDLAALVAENHDFAYVSDQGLLPNECNAFKLIQISIYEYLQKSAHEWLMAQE